MKNLWRGEFLEFNRVEDIGCVVLDRPEKANAYNQKMLMELKELIEIIREKNDFKAVVFMSSSKRYFCAGADLNEIYQRDVEEVLNLRSRKLFDKIGKMPVVTIAAISGDAVGGGLELALACDIRLCTHNARFWLSEIDHGLIPAAGGIERLPGTVGMSWANDMILVGRKLNSKEALQAGLVSRVLNDECFHDEVITIGLEICKRDRLATRIAKQVLQQRVGFVNGTPDPVIAQAFLTLAKANT
ncbi:MAG: enoyl-CoA hydratase/isomerase family protein [Candidatus Brocadiaceae bacterium]|nr:enoyl-CoA hydratase/isomerase family protein [Candidatus Brocadiaceae bacterium]